MVESQEVKELILTNLCFEVIRILSNQEFQSDVRRLLPALETIQLSFVRFSNASGTSDFDILRSFLGGRSDARLGIHAILLNQCYIEESQLDMLRSIVPRVSGSPLRQ